MKYLYLKTFFLVCLIFALRPLKAQTAIKTNEVNVIPCSSFGISKPLSELMKTVISEEENIDDLDKKQSEDRQNRPPQKFIFTEKDGMEYGEDPIVRQTVMGNRQPSPPIINIAGQNGTASPPDPTGAAGLNHYVQAVNSTPIKIYNKTTGAAIGAFSNLGSLWSPAVSNLGDPIVLYDKYADRWFLSQFGNSNKVYIAISTSPDPTGTYYTYTFTSPQFPDYEKFSIWQDGYYMTSNQNTQKVFCFERDKMLLGNAAARAISVNFTPGTVSSFFIPLPADADGALPPAGTPLPFFAYYDNGWAGGQDGIKIWSMVVNWVPSTPTAVVTSTPTFIQTSAFDATYSNGWNDIPQPGVSQMLDGIGGVCMFRAQWRKWTGYNSVVLNFAVQISASPLQRAIRWCELRQDQTTNQWSLYQEGTYAPDASCRWMGSIAMDGNGSIGLCYAVSNASTVSPSLAYTGRLPSDPLGTMSFTETIAFLGSGALTSAGNRYGDYAQTTIDPSDDITFWHTGEYVQSGSSRTRIYSFKLPLDAGIAENENGTAVINAFQYENNISVIATSLSDNSELQVDLFDIQGKQISSKKIIPVNNTFQTTIDAAALAKGTYLVRVGKPYSSFQKVKKVVLQ